MRRSLARVVAVTALLAVTAACGDGGAGAGEDLQDGEVVSVKVGAIPIVDVAPLHLGIAKGFFKEEGLDVQVVNTTGGAAAVPGVASGQFDFAFGNIVSVLLARSQGIDLKVIAEGNSSTGKEGEDFGGIVVPPGSSITSSKQLGEKTVAVNNLKNVGDTTVRASVRQAGGDPSNIKFVELAFPDMPAALAKKQVDAAWVVEPFYSIAQEQGAKVIASSFVDTAPDMTVGTYFTNADTLIDRPELTKHFVAAVKKSLKYASDNPDEARQALLTYTKITLPAWPQEINDESVETIAALMRVDGLVPEKIDAKAILP